MVQLKKIKTDFYNNNVISNQETNIMFSKFINYLNNRFSSHIENNKSIFGFVEKSKIHNYLCWHYPRVVQRGNIIKYDNKDVKLFPWINEFVIKNLKNEL